MLIILAKRSILALREKSPYSELFWSAFSCIRTEYGEILRICPYLVRMWENADQNNSEYGRFLHSVDVWQGPKYVSALTRKIQKIRQLVLIGPFRL